MIITKVFPTKGHLVIKIQTAKDFYLLIFVIEKDVGDVPH